VVVGMNWRSRLMGRAVETGGPNAKIREMWARYKAAKGGE
jgi:hypothetical protein